MGDGRRWRSRSGELAVAAGCLIASLLSGCTTQDATSRAVDRLPSVPSTSAPEAPADTTTTSRPGPVQVPSPAGDEPGTFQVLLEPAPWEPVALATGPDGRVYAVDDREESPRALVRNSSGLAERIPIDGLQHPAGIAVGADGTVVVTDGGVLRWATPDGEQQETPLPEGATGGEVALASDGTALVVDPSRAQLLAVAPDGEASTIELPDGTEPADVAVDGGGMAYVADAAAGRLVVLRDGTTEVQPVEGSVSVTSVAVLDGRLALVVDDGQGLTSIIDRTPSGEVRSLGGEQPTDVAIAGDGTILWGSAATCANTDRSGITTGCSWYAGGIGRWDPNVGDVTRAPAPFGPDGGVVSAAVDEDGTVYAAVVLAQALALVRARPGEPPEVLDVALPAYGKLGAMAVDEAGRLLVVDLAWSDPTSRIEVLLPEGAARPLPEDLPRVTELDVADDGTLLLAASPVEQGGAATELLRWDLADGLQTMGTIEGDLDGLRAPVWSGDRAWAIATSGQTGRLVEAAAGELRPTDTPPDEIVDLARDVDGEGFVSLQWTGAGEAKEGRLVAIAADGTVRRLPGPTIQRGELVGVADGGVVLTDSVLGLLRVER